MDNDPSPPLWLDAAAAAAVLGVRRDTLYAYVSRGLLLGEPDPAQPGNRARRYRRADVERLAQGRRGARRPRTAAQATLDWGLPVLPSALTLIADGRLYYCGHDAVALAAVATLEEVAALLWGCAVPTAFGPPLAAGMAGGGSDPPCALGRPTPHSPAEVLAAFAALQCSAQDTAADLRILPPAADPTGGAAQHLPDTTARQCAALLQAMVAAFTGRPPTSGPVHLQLQAAWRTPLAQADVLRAALVLCADHELNASSFTARCVASTGAGLGAAVLAGLAALSGDQHGGATECVARWWAAVDAAGGFQPWLRQHGGLAADPQRLAQQLPGMDHPLYPQGDPRAAALLARLPSDTDRTGLLAEVAAATGWHPSLDFGLVAVQRALGLPPGAAFALFAIGRTAGWLAHALEQRRQGLLIRPRAAYTGPAPGATCVAEGGAKSADAGATASDAGPGVASDATTTVAPVGTLPAGAWPGPWPAHTPVLAPAARARAIRRR